MPSVSVTFAEERWPDENVPTRWVARQDALGGYLAARIAQQDLTISARLGVCGALETTDAA